MNELERCPCCGAKAQIMTAAELFYELVGRHGSACVTVECTNCSQCGMMLFCHYESTSYDVMVAVATDRWNRRAKDVQEYIAD